MNKIKVNLHCILISIFLIFLLMSVSPVLAEMVWEDWEKITFTTPYVGEDSMKLLIDYAFGEYDMKLNGDQWFVTLELPKGIYHYTFWNSKSPKNWTSQCNYDKPVISVGFEMIATNHFRIYYKGMSKQYLRAISKLLETGYQGYIDLFGINLTQRVEMDKINVFLDVSPNHNRHRMWVTCRSIWFTTQPHILKPPTQGGNFTVYGFIHELGHLAILFHNGKTANESIADVMSTYVLSHYVWPKLGPSAWPEPYNYKLLRGEQWSRKILCDPNMEYAYLYDQEFGEYLWNLMTEQGPDFLGNVINNLTYKVDNKRMFVQQVDELLGDE